MLIFGKNNIGQLAAIATAAMLTVGLVGCSGGSGGPGPLAPGESGPTGPGGAGHAALPANVIVPVITSVSIGSAPVVNFTLADSAGTPYPGATLTANGFRFVLSQLAPPASGGKSTAWAQLAYERSSSNNLGTLVDHGGGAYTYTFSTNVAADARYAASRTTRVAFQLSTPEAGNGVYTWRPSDGATTGIDSREIVSTKTCNSCHDDLEGHSNRRETQFCVLCHTPDLGGGAAYFPYMVHQIHAGKGEWGAGIEFPQAISNCQTCHVGGDAATPQADNWESVPNAAACGSCHDNVDFATGANHAAGAATDDSCIECHGTDATIDNGRLRVARAHENTQLKFSSQFKLEVVSVQGVLQDGSPGATAGKVSPGEFARVTIRVSNPETGQNYNVLDPAGPFGGLPGATSTRLQAKINWSNQDYSNYQSGVLDRNGHLEPGYATTIDFLAGGVTNNGNGTFAKTAEAPVPASKIVGSGTVFLVARPALQVDADPLTGNPVNAYVYVDAAGLPFAITDATPARRRAVINFDNCNDCHKKVGNSAHGGTYAANNDAGFVCLACHGPDRSCPEFDAAGTPVPTAGILDMKYMIHAIHSGNYNSCGHDLTGVTPYPGKLNNCEGCHEPDTYYPVDSTRVLGTTVLNGADIANPELDANISPNKAACTGCHAATPIKSHMWYYGASSNETNEAGGGPYLPLVQQVDGTLISGNIEQCGDCHGKGKEYDIGVLHGVGNFRYNR